jgi:NAD(P)-dependent dehydrogenase (short-subunit alcohol dehydrogenase family)
MTLLLGPDIEPVRRLAASIEANRYDVPVFPSDTGWGFGDDLERWRARAAGAHRSEAVVIASWRPAPQPAALNDMSLENWVEEVELLLATWSAALGAGLSCCEDGGSVVAVIERAAPLDCAGWSALTAVSDGVEALVRSLARAVGSREVRVNAVTTPARLGHTETVDPAPSLATFPGSIEREVAGAVRLLLSSDASAVTGTVIHADCGRSWR